MGTSKQIESDTGRVHLRETGEDGREYYAGSIGKDAVAGPAPTATIAVAPEDLDERTINLDELTADVDKHTAITNPDALIGRKIPVNVALAAHWPGDDDEHEYKIDGDAITNTRAVIRETHFTEPGVLAVQFEGPDHYLTYDQDDVPDEIHLVYNGPAALIEAEVDTTDLEDAHQCLNQMYTYIEPQYDPHGDHIPGTGVGEPEAVRAYQTLNRFLEDGEAGQVALTDAIGWLIEARDNYEDGCDGYGVLDHNPTLIQGALNDLQKALPLWMVATIAQEYRSRDDATTERMLTDGDDPWV